MYTCPITKTTVATNYPYPLPHGSTWAICPDYAGDTTSLSTLTRVLGVDIPSPAQTTTPEEEQAQKDVYRDIINQLVVGYRTDPKDTPEAPIAHRRTVMLVKDLVTQRGDVVTQRGPSTRERLTVVSDPTVLHAIDAFEKGYLDVPREMVANWAELYQRYRHPDVDDVLTPEYLESIEEGWAADPTMVTCGDLDWDTLPGDVFALYSYTIHNDDAQAIAQAAQASS